jgi:hypothetical protein
MPKQLGAGPMLPLPPGRCQYEFCESGYTLALQFRFYRYGRGADVGRGRGVGVARVPVGVAVAVAVAVGVGDGQGPLISHLPAFAITLPQSPLWAVVAPT